MDEDEARRREATPVPERITPAQANEVLGYFFDEMERRDWSTSVSDITAAQQATLTHFRWSDQ